MPSLHEIDARAKPTDWADLISVAESDKTPFLSQLPKREKPNQVVHYWQCKKFKNIGFGGVQDGRDATEFDSNQGQELTGVSQKVWYNVGVSDFMEEIATVAGVTGSHLESQIAEGVKVLARSIEKKCLSYTDVSRDDGLTSANETRGILKWSDNNFTSGYAVPGDFQTPAENKYSGAMSGFFEEAFANQGISAYKQRKGPGKMDGFLGIELKKRFTEFTSYQAPGSTANGPAMDAYVPVRRFEQGQGQVLTSMVDRLVLDSGTYDLHSTSFLRCDPATGDDTAYTHKSGIFLDMDMVGLAYTRLPRVTKLPYAGGGHKAMIDAIFMLMCDNPLTMMPIEINN